jgi:hypothetical protein
MKKYEDELFKARNENEKLMKLGPMNEEERG